MSTIQSSGKKTIYLIRHAESEENRRIGTLKRSVKNLGKAKLPSSKDMAAIGELFNVAAQIDSNVSEVGNNQISRMRETLEAEGFLASSAVKLVVHSPLIRARETSLGMLGCVAPDTKVDSVDRVVETPLLSEMTPSEWTPFYRRQFHKRVTEFESWLSEQPEDSIALVGHSEYFKSMLGLNFKFTNCDVWQISFHPSKLNPEAHEESAVEQNEDRKEEQKEEEKNKEQQSWKVPLPWSDLKRLYIGKNKEQKK